MTRARWLALALSLAAVAGGAVLYDALVVTDEERVEQLADEVPGRVTEARITAARARWLDLERQPFEVSVLGRIALYRAGDEADLDRRAQALARSGRVLRVLTSGVEVRGDRATLTMRVLDDQSGMRELDWTLRKHGDDWLVSRLGVR